MLKPTIIFFLSVLVLFGMFIGGLYIYYRINLFQPPPPPNENAYFFLKNFSRNNKDLPKELTEIQQIWNYKKLFKDTPPEVLNSDIDFLKINITAQISRILSIFYSIEGEHQKALDLLAANYYIGTLLNESNTFSMRTFGVVFKGIALEGLTFYGLNACESKEDFENFRKILNKLSIKHDRRSHEDTYNGESFGFFAYFVIHRIDNSEFIKELIKKEKVENANFELLRMIVAARYKWITENKFPEKPEEFSFMLPLGLPKDPYGSGTLKYFYDKTKNIFICYSVGPDGKDDFAKKIYHWWLNTEEGDIVKEIPQVRKYPFPQDGVKVNTAEELLKIFPDGLPRDIFNSSSNNSLKVSYTSPVYIYSYGPSLYKEGDSEYDKTYIPKIEYDPTNGIRSKGDLFITLPKRESR